MATRVLDWNGLLDVAARRKTEEKIISVAGVPARVKKHLSVDAGFYVYRLDEDDPAYWALRTREEMVLLRALVDAGQVSIDDDEDPWRLEEWRTRLAAGEGCFLAGCGNPGVDQRGPVIDRAGRLHLACTRHWEGLMGELGRQHPDTGEIRAADRDQPARVLCVACGAGPDTPHDPAAHTAEAARQHRKDRP